MDTGTTYCAEYADVLEDSDEKTVTVIRTESFPSIIAMVRWAKNLPSDQKVIKKYKVNVEHFSSIDEREFQIETERKPRKVISMGA